jgi:hypothetical protein
MIGGSEKSFSSLNKSLNRDFKSKKNKEKIKLRKINKQNNMKKKSMINANVQSLFGLSDHLKISNIREKQNLIN